MEDNTGDIFLDEYKRRDEYEWQCVEEDESFKDVAQVTGGQEETSEGLSDGLDMFTAAPLPVLSTMLRKSKI